MNLPSPKSIRQALEAPILNMQKAALEAPLLKSDMGGRRTYAAAASVCWTGPESWPLASTSRSTNSITAIAALSP